MTWYVCWKAYVFRYGPFEAAAGFARTMNTYNGAKPHLTTRPGRYYV